jgi:hypothetical protein
MSGRIPICRYLRHREMRQDGQSPLTAMAWARDTSTRRLRTAEALLEAPGAEAPGLGAAIRLANE